MKILVTGASSIIAEAIIEILETNSDFEIVGISSKNIPSSDNETTIFHQVETSDFKKLRKIVLNEKPDIIINTVGLNRIEDCEQDKKLAWLLNVSYVEQLVSLSKILESWLISFSSEFVFDGKNGPYSENSTPNPENYLGKTKLAAENIIQSSQIRFTIIRLPTVYGVSVNGKLDFAQMLINTLSNGVSFVIPFDFTTNPILSDDIGWGILKLLDHPYHSVLHFGGNTFIRLSEFAMEIERLFNFEHNSQPASDQQLRHYGLIPAFAEMILDLKFSTVREGLTTFKFLYNKEESPFEKLLGN